MDQGAPEEKERSNKKEDEEERGAGSGTEVFVACGVEDRSRSLCIYTLAHGVELHSLLDSGAERNVLSETSWKQLPADKRPALQLADVRLRSVLGDNIPVLGKATIPLDLGASTVDTEFIVGQIPEDCILGMPFHSSVKAVIDYDTRQLLMKASGESVQCYSASQKPAVASVRIARTVVVEPGEEYVVPGRVHYRGFMRRLAIVDGSPRFSRQNHVLVAKSLVDTSRTRTQVPVRVFNPGSESVELTAGMFVGCLHPALAVYDQDALPEAGVQTVTTDEEASFEVPQHVMDIFDESSKILNEHQRYKLAALLREYEDVFSRGPEDLGLTDVVKHEIVLKDGPPIKQPARRMGRDKQESAEKQIQDNCDRGLASPSNSPWASPIVMVKKKDSSYRLCCDYRALNQRTVMDAYPIPRIADALDALAGAKYFSTLDLRSGYWQVAMSEDAKQKTAFCFQRGLWHWNVLPFGLCNGVATFQRLMDRVLHGLSWSTVLVYLDDVLVMAVDPDSMLQRLQEVFSRLRKANLKLHPGKCKLFQREVGYLGHLVSEHGIAPNPEKVRDVQEWPRPRDVKEVRQFLGLSGYYRRFMRGYAEVARPIIDLTKQGVPFVWTEECETAFETLKKRLTEAPILGYPRDEGELFLDTDASGYALGGILSQVQDGEERVLAYASKALSPAEQRYCTTRRELLAVVTFATHFRQYLLSKPFTVRTDHASLRWLVHMKDPMQGQFSRWLEILGEFKFRILHRPGTAHGNADAMSRRPCKANCPCLLPEEPVAPTMVEVGVQATPDSGPEELAAGVAAVGTERDSGSQPAGLPLFGGWTIGELVTAQEADPHIGPVLQLKQELGEEKPKWADYSH